MDFRTNDPARDAERYYEETKPKSIGVCEHCSDPIFEGEDYYDIHGDMIHEDCLREWADEQYKVS